MLIAAGTLAVAAGCAVDNDCVVQKTMFDEKHGNGWICQRGGCVLCVDANCPAWIRRERDTNWLPRNTKSTQTFGHPLLKDEPKAKVTTKHYPWSEMFAGRTVSREGPKSKSGGDLFYDFMNHQFRDESNKPEEETGTLTGKTLKEDGHFIPIPPATEPGPAEAVKIFF